MDDNLEVSALNSGIVKLVKDIGATLVANAKNLNVQCGCGNSAPHCHPLFKL
jgi:hypothetical protein